MINRVHLVFIHVFLLLTTGINAAPLRLERGPFDSGKIFVFCKFDSFEDSCFLDSGATFTTIAFNRFSEKYPAVGTIKHTSASGNIQTLDLIRVDEINFCDAQLKTQKIARSPSNGDIPSTIGLDMFPQKTAHFDFPKEQLELIDRVPEQISVDDLKLQDKGLITIPASIESLGLLGFWDTGAGLSAIDKIVVEKNPSLFEFVMDIDNGKDATGAPVVLKLYLLKELKIKGVSFSNVYILALDFEPMRKYIPRRTETSQKITLTDDDGSIGIHIDYYVGEREENLLLGSPDFLSDDLKTTTKVITGRTLGSQNE